MSEVYILCRFTKKNSLQHSSPKNVDCRGKFRNEVRKTFHANQRLISLTIQPQIVPLGTFACLHPFFTNPKFFKRTIGANVSYYLRGGCKNLQFLC